MNIILIGFKSCGKTTIGGVLAHTLGMAFADTDRLLEAKHAEAKNELLLFRDIYQKYGKPYFRQLEGDVLASIANFDNYVIASGGGTFINNPLSDKVRNNATLIYLQAPADVLWHRIEANGIPAFLKGPDFRADFEAHFNQRVPIYEQLADYCINSHRPVQDVVTEIKQILKI